MLHASPSRAMLADLAIRLARLDDAPGIAVMSRDAIEHGLPWSWRPGRVARAIRDADTNVAVAAGGGVLAGFGIMSYLDDDAHLLLLAVRADRRRQGVGSAVVEWLEDVARAAGARRIRVEARLANAAARSFYNELGYHERAIARGLYGGVADGVRLEKWLSTGAGA
jgi:ribosomal-protein-alanine N-acetyltransferase